MWIDGGCYLRSSKQSNTECPKLDFDYRDPSAANIEEGYCKDNNCAHPMWADGCEACMCFNNGNAAWCDGYRGDYYDNYLRPKRRIHGVIPM